LGVFECAFGASKGHIIGPHVTEIPDYQLKTSRTIIATSSLIPGIAQVDDPDRPMPLKAFHAKIVKEPFEDPVMELPVVRQIGPAEVEENFKRVKREVQELVESEMLRIMRDPVLRGVMGASK
jgi:hypothetical protein